MTTAATTTQAWLVKILSTTTEKKQIKTLAQQQGKSAEAIAMFVYMSASNRDDNKGTAKLRCTVQLREWKQRRRRRRRDISLDICGCAFIPGHLKSPQLNLSCHRRAFSLISMRLLLCCCCCFSVQRKHILMRRNWKLEETLTVSSASWKSS